MKNASSSNGQEYILLKLRNLKYRTPFYVIGVAKEESLSR